MIGISWDNFDKAFWVSSTNMRNLINSAIAMDINVGHVESDLNNAYAQINDLRDLIDSSAGSVSDLKDYVDLIVKLVETNMENQQAINEGFQAMIRDIADILVDHEKRLQDIEDVLFPKP